MDPVRMSFLPIEAALPAIEDCSRRVQGPAQLMAINAIDKPGAITGGRLARSKRPQLVEQFVAQFVIGVERQNPGARDMSQAEIALPGEIDEVAHEYRDPRIATQ